MVNTFSEQLQRATERSTGATVFDYHVSDPERFGVEFPLMSVDLPTIEEKPLNPLSNYAVTSLYLAITKA